MLSVRASSLFAGARKVYDVLSNFDPELARVEIDHGRSKAILLFDVEVPDKFFHRKSSNIKVERPVNFTFNALRSKDQLQTYNIEQISDTEYHFPADRLDHTKDYRLIMSGKPSQDALETIIRRDQYDGRIGREQYECCVVYNNGAITWEDNTVITIINNYQDQIDFDERYLPRKFRKELDEISREHHSDAWSTEYDPDGKTQSTSISLEQLPEEVQTIISNTPSGGDWWFSSKVISDFITVEGHINYSDIETETSGVPIPRGFTVISRTDFDAKAIQAKGTIIFNKGEFWKETKNEYLQKE